MARPLRLLTEHDIRRGVPVTRVVDVASQLGIPVADVVAWLQIAPRTWARRKQAGVLDGLESDRVGRLLRLLTRGTTVLGGRTEATAWMLAANPALGGRRPFDAASTEVGAEAVFDLLGRLEYGVFS